MSHVSGCWWFRWWFLCHVPTLSQPCQVERCDPSLARP
jgi:hypothetical protein